MLTSGEGEGMHIVHVFVKVKPGTEQAFAAASAENSRLSRGEPGVARFDVVQQVDDPTRFTLVEVYRTEPDAAAHKQTAHYAAWAEAVADLLAEPRTRSIYRNVAPGDEGWG